MKPLRSLTAVLLGVIVPVSPVLSEQMAQDSEIVILPAGDTFLRWFAREGRTYFIQTSDPNDPLVNWIWSDLIESGNDEPISHLVGSTADKAFFRLHYTDTPPPAGMSLEDWDADGDGLPNALELTLQTHPLNPDTSGDGIPDGWAYAHALNPAANNASGIFQGGPATYLEAYQQGVHANPDATLHDHDGDGIPNHQDADPMDADVDWQRANTSSYVLIEIDVPSDPGYIRDFNDAGHVLFDAGVWNSGIWNAFSQVETSGTVNHQEIELNYEATGNFGWRLSPQASVLEQGSFAVYGPGDLEDVGHVVRRAYSLGSNSYGSPVTTIHTLEWTNQSEQIISLGPLGEDASNRVFSYREFHPFDPDYPASQIWILNSNLVQTGSYQIPAGYRVFNHGTQVTPAGWLAVNASPHTGNAPAARTIVWNPSGQEITAPGGLPWYFSGLTELPHGKPALACRYHGANGLVYLLGQGGGTFKAADKLGGKGIHTFAGDGTAMTSDGRMWINGELIPLRDLCPAYGEMKDDGWSFQIHKANKHGVYLIEAHRAGESRPQLLVPVGIVADTDRDGVIKLPGDFSGKDDWNNDRGTIYAVNFDRDNTRAPGSNGAVYTDAITWGNQPGIPLDENWQIDNEEDKDDITPFQIHIGALPSGTKIYLTAGDQEDVHAIHVFPRRKAGQMAIWGAFQENGKPWNDPDSNPLDIEITPWLKPQEGEPGHSSATDEIVPGTYEFGLEGLVFRGMPVPHGTLENGKFSGLIDLGIEIEIPGATGRADGGSIRLKVAPFLLTHNDRPTPRVFVADEPDGLQSMPNAHVVADKFPNQWLQDHAEIGYTQRPGGPIIRTALLLPRDGALPQWPLYDFLSDNKAVFTLGNNLGGGGGDFGGNVELSCPMPGHPLGRVLAGNSMGTTLQQFLAHQEKQQPLIIDVNHTEVLHVDEILSPGPGGVTYIPDPAAAITLLQQTFNTPEKQRDALLFSQDTLPPLAATVWRSAFSPETKFLITDLDHDTVIGQWERLLVENGGYLRLVGGTSGGQVAKIKALSKAAAGDANKITGNDNPNGKLMIEVEHFYDTGAVASTNWKANKPNRPGSWYRTPQQGARIVCVQKTLRWTEAGTTPAIMSVWEVLQDANFVTFNSTTLPALIQASVTAVGIGNTVGFPALFYRGSRASGPMEPPIEFGIAYSPNSANLQWVNSSPVHPNPFGPRTADSEDVLRSRIEELSPGNPEFLDSWKKFHIMEGEVHCGSNAERIPPASWWTQFPTQPEP